MFMGIADENTTFPTVLSCPVCNKSTLYCYDDTTREDIWLACDTCSAHGNIITFAAQIWKLGLSEALNRFDEKGLCARSKVAVEVGNLTKVHTRAIAAEKFWENAKNQLWTHDDPNIISKLRDLGISKDIDCSQLIGVVHHKQIETLCKTVARGFPSQLSRAPCVVLPYYDLPQRISGFLLVQYGDDLRQSRAFIGVARNAKYTPDAGYYLMHTAQLPLNSNLGNSFFIVDDPLWVLRAQAAQLWHGSGFLPICASYTGKEATSHGVTLQMFAHAQRFFSGKTVTPGMVSQAAAARGYVSVPPERASDSPNTPRQTVKLLADMRRSAVTWQEALERVFKTNTGIAAQAFASELNIMRDKLTKFLQTRTILSSAEINKILSRITPHHGVDANKRHWADVLDRDDCWQTTSGMVISNCAPVITHVIYTDEGHKFYDGYVKKDGSTYDFFASSTDVDKPGLFNYVCRMMAEHGELVTTAPQWNVKSLSVAMMLQPPQAVTVTTMPGWNAKTREFHFRDYGMKNDGTVIATPYPELRAANPLNFPEPDTVAPEALTQLLAPSHENAALWALTAVVLADMISPALDADPIGFALDARLFDRVAPIADEFGCHSVSVGTGVLNSAGGLVRVMQHLQWPTFVESIGDNDSSIRGSLISELRAPAILKALPQSLVTATSYGWYALSPTAKFPAELDITNLKFVLPAYIQHVLRDRLAVKSGLPLFRVVLADMHKWLNQTYGESFNLLAAESLIVGPESAHILLMRDINNAITDGDIALLPQPRKSNQRYDFLIRNKQHWWINKKAVNTYLQRKTGIAPNWNALLNCFENAGVFAGEKTINNLSGFLLNKSWCDGLRIAEPEPELKKNVG